MKTLDLFSSKFETALLEGTTDTAAALTPQSDNDSRVQTAKYVYAQIMQGLEQNAGFSTITWTPPGTQGGATATLSRNQMHFLIKRLVNMSREQRKKFAHDVLADRNATMQWLSSKTIAPAPKPKQDTDPNQMQLDLPKPVYEASQKKNPQSQGLSGNNAKDAAVARELQRARAEYPAANSDIEALVRKDMDQQQQTRQDLGQVQDTNQQQDSNIGKIATTVQKQATAIEKLQQQLVAANQRVQQTLPAQTSTATPAAAPAQPTAQPSVRIPLPGPLNLPQPESMPEKDQELYARIKELEADIQDKYEKAVTVGALAGRGADMQADINRLQTTVADLQAQLQAQIETGVKDRTTQQQEVDMLKQSQALAGVVDQMQMNKTPAQDDVFDLGQAREYLGQLGKKSRAKIAAESVTLTEGRMKQALYDFETVSDAEFAKKYGMSKREFYTSVVNTNKQPVRRSGSDYCPVCDRADNRCICETASPNGNKLRNKNDYLDKREIIYRLLSQPGLHPETIAAAKDRLQQLEQLAKQSGFIDEAQLVNNPEAGHQIIPDGGFGTWDEQSIKNNLARKFTDILDQLKGRGYKQIYYALYKHGVIETLVKALAEYDAFMEKQGRRPIGRGRTVDMGPLSESLRAGEYHVATVTLDDGKQVRVPITSDEHFIEPIKQHFEKQGKKVVDIDIDWSIHSNLAENFTGRGQK
jgi:hypothetical protein